MKLAILSDIHANLSAFEAVLSHINERYGGNIAYLQLGDIINYGPRPNEVLERLTELEKKGNLLVNLAGNHEAALFDMDVHKFSSKRGLDALYFTKRILHDNLLQYIHHNLLFNYCELSLSGKSFLFVHESLSDIYWDHLNGEKTRDPLYKKYDYVLSGHSHIPHVLEVMFRDENPAKRDRKKVVFLNPGSVGQPRNQNNRAQYAFLDGDSGEVHINRVPYDIDREMLFFSNEVDVFYKERLKEGI